MLGGIAAELRRRAGAFGLVRTGETAAATAAAANFTDDTSSSTHPFASRTSCSSTTTPHTTTSNTSNTSNRNNSGSGGDMVHDIFISNVSKVNSGRVSTARNEHNDNNNIIKNNNNASDGIRCSPQVGQSGTPFQALYHRSGAGARSMMLMRRWKRISTSSSAIGFTNAGERSIIEWCSQMQHCRSTHHRSTDSDSTAAHPGSDEAVTPASNTPPMDEAAAASTTKQVQENDNDEEEDDDITARGNLFLSSALYPDSMKEENTSELQKKAEVSEAAAAAAAAAAGKSTTEDGRSATSDGNTLKSSEENGTPQGTHSPTQDSASTSKASENVPLPSAPPPTPTPTPTSAAAAHEASAHVPPSPPNAPPEPHLPPHPAGHNSASSSAAPKDVKDGEIDDAFPVFKQGKTDYCWKKTGTGALDEPLAVSDHVPVVTHNEYSMHKRAAYFGMPQGYPYTCAPGYRMYFFLSISSSFVSNFATSIGYQTLLNGFFLESTPQLWMLKDLIPALFAAFMANKIVSYESRPKFWFVVSVVMNNVSVITDMMIPHFLQNHYYHFFLAAIFTSIVKQSSALMFFVARASALQHFAINNNLAELTKKFNSFGMVIYTIATASGICYTYLVTSFFWQVVTVIGCCLINLVLAPLSMSNIAFRILNVTTMPIILREYIFTRPTAGIPRPTTLVAAPRSRFAPFFSRVNSGVMSITSKLDTITTGRSMHRNPASDMPFPSAVAPAQKVAGTEGNATPTTPAPAPPATPATHTSASPIQPSQWSTYTAGSQSLLGRKRRVLTPEELSEAMGVRMLDRYVRPPDDRTDLFCVSPAVRDIVIRHSTLQDDVLFVSHSGYVQLALWEVRQRKLTVRESWLRWERPSLLPKSISRLFTRIAHIFKKTPAVAPVAAAEAEPQAGSSPSTSAPKESSEQFSEWSAASEKKAAGGKKSSAAHRHKSPPHHAQDWAAHAKVRASTAATSSGKHGGSTSDSAWNRMRHAPKAKSEGRKDGGVPKDSTATTASHANTPGASASGAKAPPADFGNKKLVLLVHENCDPLNMIMVYLVAYHALLLHANTEAELRFHLRKCHSEQELWRVRAMEFMNALYAANWDTELLALDPPDFRLSSLILPKPMNASTSEKRSTEAGKH